MCEIIWPHKYWKTSLVRWCRSCAKKTHPHVLQKSCRHQVRRQHCAGRDKTWLPEAQLRPTTNDSTERRLSCERCPVSSKSGELVCLSEWFPSALSKLTTSFYNFCKTKPQRRPVAYIPRSPVWLPKTCETAPRIAMSDQSLFCPKSSLMVAPTSTMPAFSP
jgi:hypothetical protein